MGCVYYIINNHMMILTIAIPQAIIIIVICLHNVKHAGTLFIKLTQHLSQFMSTSFQVKAVVHF